MVFDGTDGDDLDRAFGPDTASVATRTTKQRVGRSALVGGGVVLAAVVLGVVLLTIVASVQNGVGGIFPRPQAALDQFRTSAERVDGVERVRDTGPVKTSFASYDVVSRVTVTSTLSDGERTAVVDALRRAADDASGNGVRVFALADLGPLQVGVSADQQATGRRLTLARQLAAIGGVTGARCAWPDDAPSDDATAQRITVFTRGTGAGLGAVIAEASKQTTAVFPGASVASALPPAG